MATAVAVENDGGTVLFRECADGIDMKGITVSERMGGNGIVGSF